MGGGTLIARRDPDQHDSEFIAAGEAEFDGVGGLDDTADDLHQFLAGGIGGDQGVEHRQMLVGLLIGQPRFHRLPDRLADCFATTTGTRYEIDDSNFWTLRGGVKAVWSSNPDPAGIGKQDTVWSYFIDSNNPANETVANVVN